MRPDSPLELRVEAYGEEALPKALVEGIGSLLARRWPVEWDVTIPEYPDFDHPAEWRATVPLPEASTPETVHRELAKELNALDSAHVLRFRTRWDFPQAPDQREVYEEHWKPSHR